MPALWQVPQGIPLRKETKLALRQDLGWAQPRSPFPTPRRTYADGPLQ